MGAPLDKPSALTDFGHALHRVPLPAREHVRGEARLQRFHDGHARLWTGRVNIFLQAPAGPALVDRMIQELHGFGINRALQAGTPLSAPDFSGCPPVDVPPLKDPPIGG